MAFQLAVEHGLDERTQQQGVGGGHEMQRPADHDDADHLAIEEQPRKCFGIEIDEPGPQTDVRVRGNLGLEPDEVGDGVEHRHRAALEEVLARERRSVQRACSQPVGTAHASIVARGAGVPRVSFGRGAHGAMTVSDPEPEVSMLHRWVGWHAPALRRLLVDALGGLVVAVVLLPFVDWTIALIIGWDVFCTLFLASIWLTVMRADGPKTQKLARREDETRTSAAFVLLAASVTSVLAVAIPLSMAGKEEGGTKVALIAVATVTVVLSWFVVNTVFTLRYADLYFRAQAPVIDFGCDDVPNYQDFAYVAFTIGMTYQVSDTTLRNRSLRRTVLSHALMSYLFGVVIVAAAINLIAGLVR